MTQYNCTPGIVHGCLWSVKTADLFVYKKRASATFYMNKQPQELLLQKVCGQPSWNIFPNSLQHSPYKKSVLCNYKINVFLSTINKRWRKKQIGRLPNKIICAMRVPGLACHACREKRGTFLSSAKWRARNNITFQFLLRGNRPSKHAN